MPLFLESLAAAVSTSFPLAFALIVLGRSCRQATGTGCVPLRTSLQNVLESNLVILGRYLISNVHYTIQLLKVTTGLMYDGFCTSYLDQRALIDLNVMPPGLSTLAPRKPRSATDAELCLVQKRAAAKKSGSGVIWLPATGCLEPWDPVRHMKGRKFGHRVVRIWRCID